MLIPPELDDRLLLLLRYTADVPLTNFGIAFACSNQPVWLVTNQVAMLFAASFVGVQVERGGGGQREGKQKQKGWCNGHCYEWLAEQRHAPKLSHGWL